MDDNDIDADTDISASVINEDDVKVSKKAHAYASTIPSGECT